MHWTEPAKPEDSTADLESRLWAAANQLWANAALKPSEFSPVVLGAVFLRFADVRFTAVEEELAPAKVKSSRRKIGPADYHAKGVLYLPDESRFATLLALPEGSNLGQSVNDAMRAIEHENPDLADVLPKTYHILENRTLAELLKVMASIPMDRGGDTFGLIYEYFLGKFAMSEGQKGGEFYTPTSIVRLIVEILEPYHGRIYDPACGSGGMFVQSARFVENHHKNPTAEISVHGQERVRETSRLARLNLAVHGISGDIREGNAYYEDLHDGLSRFDFVLANPPFNVSKVDKDRIADDPRFPFGLPRTDNANYLWIQLFYSYLNPTGRAGFVMANSASDARASEQDIRERLIRSGHVDVMVAIGSNFFFTVTLPCTLWFLDRGKADTPREDTVLFLDARHIYRQLDRAHRDFTADQIDFLANVVRLYRQEERAVAHHLLELLLRVEQKAAQLGQANYGNTEGGGRKASKIWTTLEKWIRLQDTQNDEERRNIEALRDRIGELEVQSDWLYDLIEAFRESCNDDAVNEDPTHIFGRVRPTCERLRLQEPDLLKFGETLDAVARRLSEAWERTCKDPGFKKEVKDTGKVRQWEELQSHFAAASDYLKKMLRGCELVNCYTDRFPVGTYADIPGLCKAAARADIEAQGWSLNPGRYVGVAKGKELSDEDFKEKLEALNEELEVLNAEARELEQRIAENVTEILETA